MNPFTRPRSPELKNILNEVQTIAVIGCSSNPYRTSYHISEYLVKAGFTIFPINPNEERVHGRKAYSSMADLPEDVTIDLVNIFRNKRYTTETVKEIIEWGEERNQKPVIWTQLDVSTDQAKELAGENGFTYVENRCIMVEHR
ncbi:MAG: CoA-binding protein [Balneolaceae bacterium]|nr:CoA-binding protein [Balneolaceae bacterium]